MKQNGATVILTDLTEGQYQFKVTVNGSSYYGEGYTNVTVLPPQRNNTPPQVVITPQSQTVKLPNSGAVLDGSASKVRTIYIAIVKHISLHWYIPVKIGKSKPELIDNYINLGQLSSYVNSTSRKRSIGSGNCAAASRPKYPIVSRLTTLRRICSL